MGEDAILLQARTFERLCLGQLHETVGPQPDDEHIAHYIQVLADKTGALISTAARMGVMFGGGTAEHADAVTEYGERIGVAFQLIDDVIDLSPERRRRASAPAPTCVLASPPLPMLLLRNRAAQATPTRTRSSPASTRVCGRSPTGATSRSWILRIADALRAHEVTRETEREAAQRWADEAVEALTVLPEVTGEARAWTAWRSPLFRRGNPRFPGVVPPDMSKMHLAIVVGPAPPGFTLLICC